MSNMSYCRFQNTNSDLADCVAALEEMTSGAGGPLSRTELEAAKDLALNCAALLQLVADAAALPGSADLDDLERASAQAIDAMNESAACDSEEAGQ